MDYLSAKEAAEKWGVSLRYVQRLLHDNRIPGAKKYGNNWLLPAGAEKPRDPRHAQKDVMRVPIPYLPYTSLSAAIPMPRDNPDAVLHTLSDEKLRLQYEGEIAYYRGDFERAKRCFSDTLRNDSTKLCACLTAMSAAVSTGDYFCYREAEAFMKSLPIRENSPVAPLVELNFAMIAMSMFLPNMAPEWLKNGNFDAFTPSAKPFVIYLYIKYLQASKQYDAMLATAKTALAFCTDPTHFTSCELYMYLMAADASCELQKLEEAVHFLDKACAIAIPSGFITPLAENVTILGGMMEKYLAARYPEYCSPIISLSKKTIKNWVSFHNRFSKDHITLILTLKESHVARLLANGVTYAQAAQRMNMSVGSINNLISDIYNKLYIHSKRELADFIL